MRNLIGTRLIPAMVLLALLAGPAAIAQTGAGTGASAKGDKQVTPSAPVGHRQPKAGDVPSEKNPTDPNDTINRENAALDRSIKSICRGC